MMMYVVTFACTCAINLRDNGTVEFSKSVRCRIKHGSQPHEGATIKNIGCLPDFALIADSMFDDSYLDGLTH
jgi:hypothetical protein